MSHLVYGLLMFDFLKLSIEVCNCLRCSHLLKYETVALFCSKYTNFIFTQKRTLWNVEYMFDCSVVGEETLLSFCHRYTYEAALSQWHSNFTSGRGQILRRIIRYFFTPNILKCIAYFRVMVLLRMKYNILARVIDRKTKL